MFVLTTNSTHPSAQEPTTETKYSSLRHVWLTLGVKGEKSQAECREGRVSEKSTSGRKETALYGGPSSTVGTFKEMDSTVREDLC